MALLFQSMEDRLASKQRLVRRLCLKYCGCRVTRRSALGIVSLVWPHFAQNLAGPSLANEAGSRVATIGANMGAKQEVSFTELFSDGKSGRQPVESVEC